jgi:ribosome maturation factor RimP
MYPRQYVKHIGRTLEITLKDEALVTEIPSSAPEAVKLEGKLQAADNQGITIEYEEVRKEGKKKIKENIVQIIPFEKINKAFVKISFK